MSNPELPSKHGPQEACGVTAIYSKQKKNVTGAIPFLQHALRNRGRDSAGMAVFDEATMSIQSYTGLGEVRTVFGKKFQFRDHNLDSFVGIGHNRYGTSGGENKDDILGAQPVIAEWMGQSIAVAFNGNLPESQRDILKQRIPDEASQNPDYDTYDIAQAIITAPGENMEEKIYNGLKDVQMAYAITLLTNTGELYAVRGPSGTWPMRYGETDENIIFSSETRVAKSKKVTWTELQPGEIVKATPQGVEKKQLFEKLPRRFQCTLMDAYGARFDSQMTPELTYGDFRELLGRKLAEEFPIEADLYIGIPETGLVIAKGYAEALGKTSTEYLQKKRELKSFIAKNHDEINTIITNGYLENQEFIARVNEAKSVVLIDDSLIRFNTSRIITDWFTQKGIDVNWLSTLDKMTDDCDMGIYLLKKQLGALSWNEDGTYDVKNNDELARMIGAKSMNFLTKEKIKEVYEAVYGRSDVACMHCMGEPHPLHEIQSEKTISRPVTLYSRQRSRDVFGSAVAD